MASLPSPLDLDFIFTGPYMMDLDGDMLENEDYGDSDIWFVTDISSCRSDVDEEDDCDLYISLVAAG